MDIEELEEWKRREVERRLQKDVPHLEVRYKYIWGRHLYEPINKRAKDILAKTNRKNFSVEQIKQLQGLGVVIDIITPEIPVATKNRDQKDEDKPKDEE
jgi:hypothetical protein